jgi:uncharacterized protein YprB with RNaseH-like and TPR domain
MQSIRDRLEALYAKAGQQPAEPQTEPPIRHELDRLFQHQSGEKFFPKSQLEQKAQSISDLVNGSWINTHFGDIFRAEFEYSLDEPYGNLLLNKIFSFTAETYTEIFQIPNIQQAEELIFIDTETTGLSGGTGTIAFLVGLGFIRNQRFLVHQYFITQLSHEEGLLELLQQIIPNFQCLVTYNGKTFDIPILNARFVLNRLPSLPENMPHIDLLHPTRTIWKYSLENCKLKTIETDRLQLYREDDIPGELIPDVYFDYLRNRRIDKIERIFYHNRFDIITMLANLILIIKSYQTVEPEDNPLTDYAKARLFTRKKDIERSISHYQNVLNSQISASRRQKTCLEIAALYKKLKKYDEALHYWQAAIHPDQPFNLEPYIEQAKYFEHKLKDLNRAIEIVEQALDNLPLLRSMESNLLIHRLNRLNLKLAHHNRY